MRDSLATVVDTLRERRLFEPGASVSIARAPGRLDVMGGIADYSGSLVLERPIAEATWAAVQRIDRPVLAERGLPPALTCHPYDICCALIAQESGVIVTNPRGQPLDAPLNVEAEVAWAGYANARVRSQVEPLLQQTLRARKWIDDEG